MEIPLQTRVTSILIAIVIIAAALFIPQSAHSVTADLVPGVSDERIALVAVHSFEQTHVASTSEPVKEAAPRVIPRSELVVRVASKDAFKASVSAFTSTVEETDSTPDITASGTRVREGVAACPRRYAFGTKFQIGSKVYICEDRMATRFQGGNYFDIWFSSRAEAIEWGRRTVEVDIIKS